MKAEDARVVTQLEYRPWHRRSHIDLRRQVRGLYATKIGGMMLEGVLYCYRFYSEQLRDLRPSMVTSIEHPEIIDDN